MTREQAIGAAYGRLLTRPELDDIERAMNREMDAFVDRLATAGLRKEEGWHFFLGRLGANYDKYQFSWEAFRDFAGPLFRRPDAVPVVVVSSDSESTRPSVKLVGSPSRHYQIAVTPACPVLDIANAWLETLADAGAMPQEGGEENYRWFFEKYGLSPQDTSVKARRFVNSFK